MTALPPKNERLLFRAREVAELTGRSVQSIWRDIQLGRIETVRIAGTVRVKHDEVARLLRELSPAEVGK